MRFMTRCVTIPYVFGYYLTDELYSIEHGHGFGITDMGLSSDFSPRNSAHIARL